MQLNVVLTLIFAVVITVFAVVNSAAVTVNLIFTTLELSLAIVIVASGLIGACIIWFFGIVKIMRLKKKIKDESRKCLELEKLLTQNELSIKSMEEKIFRLEEKERDLMKREALSDNNILESGNIEIGNGE